VVHREIMALKAKPVTRDVTQPVTRNLQGAVERLEREVAELRKLIADMSAPSANKRAVYMREYRKRLKPQE